MCDTPSHGSDHLWLIWKESIQNCRCYRADTAAGTDGRTDGQTDGQTDGVKPIYPPTTSLFGGYNKNTLEMCKNPRPTSDWSELTKSCTTSTMNFHMAYFSWIPQNNARLKLSCKFGESKCNPYRSYITLTTSHGMNYVLNEHLDFSQHDPYAIPPVIILWYS